MPRPTARQAAKMIAFRLLRIAIGLILMLVLRQYLHAESPAMQRGNEAMLRKDYNTAWREYMASAQQGDADAEAAIGSMLFMKINPVGTGFYADCEKWLAASARQNNPHGLTNLGRFYYADGVRIAGGINPGINTSPIPPQLQAIANHRFAQAREMFERAATLGDGYAMGNLAIMLDAGVGGPSDPQRAGQLRAGVSKHSDTGFAAKVNTNPGFLAIQAAWQSGNYAQALQSAQILANKGDANGEAILGRAYYEGVGTQRNYQSALYWLNKSAAQNNADAIFFLGLMYEHGRGIRQDLNYALQLFDHAARLGNRYAQMEAAGMRLQGESNRIAALARGNSGTEDIACQTAGGVSTPGACIKGGSNIDPWNPTTY